MKVTNVPNAATLCSVTSGSRRRSAARPSGHNLKLEIEYDGTNYCGWQVQGRHKRKASIQETLEKTLQKILQEKIRLVASGRTDSGVHARCQVANFKTTSNITLEKLERALNALLPEDITITRIEEKNLDFNSRFDAQSKSYRYTILNRKYPCALLRNRVYFYPYPLNVKLMQREAKSLLGRHDFKAFCASGSSVKDTVRTIKRISLGKTDYELSGNSLMIIDIEADGFLYNMVRNIVGTLLEIGRGRFPKGYLKKLLLLKNRKLAGPTVPAKGLYLLEVKY